MIGARTRVALLHAIAALDLRERVRGEGTVRCDLPDDEKAALYTGVIGRYEGPLIIREGETNMGIHGASFTQKPLNKQLHVPADSEAGRRMTGAFRGNESNTGKPTQGAKEIARRKRQMEKARA